MRYNQIYKNNNVWGSQPNELLQKIYNQLKASSYFLDLGCGLGRHSILFAKEVELQKQKRF